jgi:hypothetical protein
VRFDFHKKLFDDSTLLGCARHGNIQRHSRCWYFYALYPRENHFPYFGQSRSFTIDVLCSQFIEADPSNLMVKLATSGDRPGFFGKRFPPLWRPRQGASFSLVGKGVALLFGDLVPSVKYVMNMGQRAARSYLATVSQLFVLVRGPPVAEKLHTATPNIIYHLWSVIRPTSIISGFLGGILHSFRWYQRSMPCQGDAPAASSLVNVIRTIDHAICSFYPEVLKNSTPINSVFNYWVLASLHEIATDRTSAIMFGYLITIVALALHARISVQRNSYMVLMLFKVCGVPSRCCNSEHP